MEDGGAFIWLIFIAIAVVQAIGQKKRKAGQAGQGQAGKARPRPTPPPGQEHPGLPAGQGRGPAAASSSASASTTPEGGDEEAGSSEGMLPSDVWAEILGLARGAPQGKGQGVPAPTGTTTSPLPGEEGPREVEPSELQPGELQPVELRSREVGPREVRPREVRSRETTPAESVAPREGREAAATRTFPTSHGASAALHETDPSDFESRLHVADSSKDDGGSKGREGVREGLFGSGSVEELRKAIILKEVLGAPLALRDE